MPRAKERFRAKIRRRGDHDIWTGFTDHRGVGMVRIDGKLHTVQRAAWELALGPVPDGQRVNTCAGERARVGLEHLSISRVGKAPQPNRRKSGARGIGSQRELRPGVWQLVVVEGSRIDGTPIRRYRTVHGDEHTAATALESTAAHVARASLGDLRVGELLRRYLHAHHDAHSPAYDRDRAILDQLVDPAVGYNLAAFLTEGDVITVVRHAYRHGGTESARLTLGLVRDGYRWAHRQRWTDRDPTAGVTLRGTRRHKTSPPP